MNFQKAEFIKSAAAPGSFIDDGLPQIVFSGRSNVGKSSVINSLLHRRNLARTSSSPGKTIHINYFLVDGAAYFVDLPGYGYAKVPKTERARWAVLMESFFADSGRVALGVMLVDARHKPTADDATMASWFKSTGRPVTVVANKSDKVKRSELDANIRAIDKALGFGAQARLIPFSASDGTNREALTAEIENAVYSWYNSG